MARPWLSLLLLYLVLGVIEALREYACPENNVCVLFANNTCRLNGSVLYSFTDGHIWEPNLECAHIEGNIQAILEIAPISLRTWSFTVATHHPIEKLEFTFSYRATISFPNNKTMKFYAWLKSDADRDSYHHLNFVDCYELSNHLLCKYSFTIDISEKLIKFIGPDHMFYISSEPKGKSLMKDRRFAQQLDRLTACDPSEIKQVCYGECRKFHVPDHNRSVDCNEKIWYHAPTMIGIMRSWHQSDHNSFECKMGEWTLGSEEIDTSFEWQCDDAEPARAIGITTCIVLAGCVIIVVMYLRRIFQICREVIPPSLHFTHSLVYSTVEQLEEQRIIYERERRHEIDSVVICDDYPPFRGEKIFATYGDGRFIFELGEQRVAVLLRFRDRDSFPYLCAPIAVLNTKTMRWTEIKAAASDDERLLSFPDGSNLVIQDEYDSVEGSRVIGEARERAKMARYRLIRHPTRVPSLARLASIALQRSGLLGTKELEMIAERIY